MDQKSRTQKKKEALALQELGKQLAGLSADQLGKIGLPQELYEALMFVRSIREREALRRQMQYIGSLMRQCDVEPITRALQNIEQGRYRRDAEFRETERWREELISGNKALLEEILAKYQTDRKELTRLIRNAVQERQQNSVPKAYRALFRYLRELRSAGDENE